MTDFRKKLLRFLPLTFDQVAVQHDVDLGQYADLPTGFHGTNPSLMPYEDGYLVCIRGLNYLLSGKDMAGHVFTAGDHFMTVNRFFLVDHAFQFQRALPGLNSIFDNVEDIKLFGFNGVIMGAGSCPHPEKGGFARSIGVVTIDPSFEGGQCQVVASPFGLDQEKNWAPFVHEGALHFVYSFDPLIILRYDPVAGSVSFADPRFARFTREDLKFLVGGSSAGLTVPGGFLFAAHRRRVSFPQLYRSYISRLYYLKIAGMTMTAGRFFTLGPASIQFINGIAQLEDDLVFSYGQMDQSAYLCRVPAKRLAPVVLR